MQFHVLPNPAFWDRSIQHDEEDGTTIENTLVNLGVQGLLHLSVLRSGLIVALLAVERTKR